MPKKSCKKYYEYEFDTNNPEFFEDKRICFYFEKVDDNRYRLMLRDEKEAQEIVKFIHDNLSNTSINSYNKAIETLARDLKVIITKDACRQQVEEATRDLNIRLEKLQIENEAMRRDAEVQKVQFENQRIQFENQRIQFEALQKEVMDLKNSTK